jgi:hypothetical protein
VKIRINPILLAFGLLVLVAAGLLFFGLGNAFLWEDEAYTASLARNILSTGLPTAWDGENLLAWHNGQNLNEKLINREAWVQYYLGAASFALLGESALAARFPFALLGLATIVVFYYCTARHLNHRGRALLCTAFLALSVPFLLYSRTARYYAPAMFLGTICWFLSLDLTLRRKRNLVLFVICCALLFHTNYVVFAAFFAALGLLNIFFQGRGQQLKALLLSVPFIVLLTLPWYLWIKPQSGWGPYFLPNLRRGNPFYLFYGHLRDYNTFGFFPALMVVALIGVGAWLWKRNRFIAQCLWGAVALVLLFTLAFSVLSPQQLLPAMYVDVRYATVLLPAFAFILGILCFELFRIKRWLGVVVVLLVLFTDFLSLREFLPGYSEMVKLSSPIPLPFNCYLAEHIHEITHRRVTPNEVAVKWLADRIKSGELAITSPPESDAPLIFYLGHKLRFSGKLREDDGRLTAAWRDCLPSYVYSHQVAPDWVISFTRQGIRDDIAEWIHEQQVPYEAYVLPAFGVDMSRPDIPFRTFKEIAPRSPEERITILHRLGPAPPASGDARGPD